MYVCTYIHTHAEGYSRTPVPDRCGRDRLANTHTHTHTLQPLHHTKKTVPGLAEGTKSSTHLHTKTNTHTVTHCTTPGHTATH